MTQPDLFATANADALTAAGWSEAAGYSQGVRYWRSPGGDVLGEEEALRRLEQAHGLRQQAQDATSALQTTPGSFESDGDS